MKTSQQDIRRIKEMFAALLEFGWNPILEKEYVIGLNKNLKILIQTDTSQFIDYINDKKIDNITISENETSYSNKGIHNENKREDNYYHMLDFLSTVIIMSKCKYILNIKCHM